MGNCHLEKDKDKDSSPSPLQPVKKCEVQGEASVGKLARVDVSVDQARHQELVVVEPHHLDDDDDDDDDEGDDDGADGF